MKPTIVSRPVFSVNRRATMKNCCARVNKMPEKIMHLTIYIGLPAIEFCGKTKYDTPLTAVIIIPKLAFSYWIFFFLSILTDKRAPPHPIVNNTKMSAANERANKLSDL